jgi:hypothetical protein
MILGLVVVGPHRHKQLDPDFSQFERLNINKHFSSEILTVTSCFRPDIYRLNMLTLRCVVTRARLASENRQVIKFIAADNSIECFSAHTKSTRYALLHWQCFTREQSRTLFRPRTEYGRHIIQRWRRFHSLFLVKKGIWSIDSKSSTASKVHLFTQTSWQIVLETISYQLAVIHTFTSREWELLLWFAGIQLVFCDGKAIR